MQKKAAWFFIEPYVNIFLKKDKVILYNNINCRHIEVNNNKIKRLIQKLASKKNLYVIKLDENDLNDSEINNFIIQTKDEFIGDIVDYKWSETKPIQLTPQLKIDKVIRGKKNNEDIVEMEYLLELSLFINSTNNNINHENKQFLFCANKLDDKYELKFEFINYLMLNTNASVINILGSNIFIYSKFNEFIKLLKEKNIGINYYSNYQNPYISIKNLKKIKSNNSNFKISVSAPIDIRILQKVKEIIEITEISHSFDFKVESEQDVELFENIITQLAIVNYTFRPYYNGENLNLFKEAVFLNKEDIFEAKPTQRDIFARQSINQLNFGKLYILTDSSVYSNLNTPKLGMLKQHSIYKLVNKEMYKNRNWFKLRKNVKPCKSCVYNLLCPSVSNYEYVIGKYNLCHVWKN